MYGFLPLHHSRIVLAPNLEKIIVVNTRDVEFDHLDFEVWASVMLSTFSEWCNFFGLLVCFLRQGLILYLILACHFLGSQADWEFTETLPQFP